MEEKYKPAEKPISFPLEILTCILQKEVSHNGCGFLYSLKKNLYPSHHYNFVTT